MFEASHLFVKVSKLFPNGLCFDAASIERVCKELGIDTAQAFLLKNSMLPLRSYYFCPEMLATAADWRQLLDLAHEWLHKYTLFSVPAFFAKVQPLLRFVENEQECAELLRWQGFTLKDWGDITFCLSHASSTTSIPSECSPLLLSFLAEHTSVLAEQTLFQHFPHLDRNTLITLRKQLRLPIASVQEHGERFWYSFGVLDLPPTFPGVITRFIDSLFTLKKKVSDTHLRFLLDVWYSGHFTKAYHLEDKLIFLQCCVANYQGPRLLFVHVEKKLILEEIPMTHEC